MSRDFTTNIGGYLSLDWSHLILRTKHGAKLKIVSEPLHSKHIVDEAMINFEATHASIIGNELKCIELVEDKEITSDRNVDQEVFLMNS